MRLSVMLPLQGAAVLALSGMLAACTVAVDEGPGYRPPPRPEHRYCTREYEPVCASRGRDRKTFSNGCEAERSGYRIVGRGECRRHDDVGSRPPPRACTMEYAPVCGSKRGRLRTFSNACTARASDYRVIGRGPCRG